MTTVELWENPNGRSPVAELIDNLPEKTKKKIIRTLQLLETYGRSFLLHSKDMKKLEGYELYELRIDFGKIRYRILCVFRDITCVLLHMFEKKGPHTPQRHINTALSRAVSAN